MGLRYQPLAACMNVARASTKLVRGENGLLETRALDEPAYDHDRLGRRLGLLIEGAATNLLRYSNAFDNALWEKNNGVVVSSSATPAPDGTTTAMQLDLPGSAAGADGLYQNVSGLVASDTYSLAIWMRAVSGTADITLGGIDGPSTHGFTLDENWQRVWMSEPASGTSSSPKISTAITALPASILIWNAQLEAGPAPTSDIISNGIPAARAADDVRLDPGDWFVQSKGTLVFDLHTPLDWAGIWRIVQMYSTSLNDDHLDLGYDSVADQLRISLRAGGVPIITQSLYGSLAKDSRHRIGLAWEDDRVSVGLDGVVLSSPDGFAMPRNFANIVLGSFGGVDKTMNGHLRNLAYWPEKLSHARLSQLSVI